MEVLPNSSNKGPGRECGITKVGVGEQVQKKSSSKEDVEREGWLTRGTFFVIQPLAQMQF